MALEIERKFLIKGKYKHLAIKSERITQAYLSLDPERTVRVRIKGHKGFITIKGIANNTGTSRYEWEKEINKKEAEELLELCLPGIIDKTRYIIPAYDNLYFEADEFHGLNQGLLMAEIELPTEETPFVKPDWLGEEVTGIEKYYNSMLMKKPFNEW
jgi:adenylate cyclase